MAKRTNHSPNAPSDHNQPDYCYIRFQQAETLERQGKFETFNADAA